MAVILNSLLKAGVVKNPCSPFFQVISEMAT